LSLTRYNLLEVLTAITSPKVLILFILLFKLSVKVSKSLINESLFSFVKKYPLLCAKIIEDALKSASSVSVVFPLVFAVQSFPSVVIAYKPPPIVS